MVKASGRLSLLLARKYALQTQADYAPLLDALPSSVAEVVITGMPLSIALPVSKIDR